MKLANLKKPMPDKHTDVQALKMFSCFLNFGLQFLLNLICSLLPHQGEGSLESFPNRESRSRLFDLNSTDLEVT